VEIYCWTINFSRLKPRKAKELIPQTARELDISEDLVNDVVSFYWREVRSSLSSLKHSRVHITNLGDFLIKTWKLDETIQRIQTFEEANKLKGMQLINARFRTAESLYNLYQVKKMIEEENQRAEFIKMHKKNVDEAK